MDHISIINFSAKLNLQEDALTQGRKAWESSSSDDLCCISSKDKLNAAGPCDTQEDAPQPESPVEASACNEAAGVKSSFSEHFVCVFSPSKLPPPNEDAKMNLREEAFQHRHKAVALTQGQKARKPSSSDSLFCSSCKDKLNGAEPCSTQEDVPQPESPLEALACSQAVGENSPSYEYFTCVSTASKLPCPNKDGIKEMPISQDSEQMEDSSDYSHTYIPSHLLNNNKPFMSPVLGTDLRLMKIYYMRVQLKRDVAVLCHTEEGFEPPSKKIKMEEMTYIEKVHKNVPFSHMSERKHLIAPEPILDSRAQEKREEADSPAQPPSLSRYPSANTPEWLVAQDSGFRCMACCRVFPSLEVLQEHVECGVREGFSCHAFHNAMARLKHKERKRSENEKIKKGNI
uniref:Family with sequence similarity 170 member A n=1 Tax=Pipistrellus kuhlii TaxID=59472 RepID=A0A7J7YYE9_PIPKU|nr:hypothetical protein mPipKuh1_009892 [Pipistrellus kuhlii]